MELLEKQKQEAIKRLNVLRSKGLMTEVVNAFIEKDLVFYSEKTALGGILYWFTEDNGVPKSWIESVKKFEDEYKAKVFHITHETTQFGEMLDLFYVSKNEEEWEMDNKDLDDNKAYCYCINLAYSDCSEIGQIAFKCLGGGVVRTA